MQALRARLLLGVLGVVALGAVPQSVGADGAVALSSTRVAVAAGSYEPVEVRWTGQRPNSLVFLIVCRRPTASPGFEVGTDCASLTQVTPNGTPTGSGRAEVPVFRGPDPSGDLPWGCFAPGDAAPPGVEKLTTCYVRLTTEMVLNNDAAVDVPFTLTASGAPPSRGVLGAPTAAPAPESAPAAPVEAGPPPGPTTIRFAG